MQSLKQLHKLKSRSTIAPFVEIVEVGPRDGLQNESAFCVTTQGKVAFARLLARAGLKRIEAAAFVSPKWMPQMADGCEVMSMLLKGDNDVRYSAIVPNLKGLDRAIATGVKEIALFGSATEGFSRKNTNCSLEENIDRVKVVRDKAVQNGIRVRFYLSCVFGCPYDGKVKSKHVADVARRFNDIGFDELALSDTIGVGDPKAVTDLIRDVSQECSVEKLAVHFHNTYGQALANILTALNLGVTVVDSSAAGLGGCPYAKGASGNVATEDLLFMLDNMGVETGVDMDKLLEASAFISNVLQRPTTSKVGLAMSSQK